MSLSAVIISKNEEKNLERALSSLSFCDEIVLVDTGSTDKTIEIARNHNAKILTKDFDDDFSALRNFGLQKAKGEWVLFIDADEVVGPELTGELKNIEKNNPNSAYYLRRRDFWRGWELKYGEVSRVRTEGLIRLVKKDTGIWEGKVHERFITKNATGKLAGFIDHYPHPTLEEFISDINYYSTLRAKELAKQGKKVGIFGIITYPFVKFLISYILKMGFLVGSIGFIYAFLMSCHSFLVRVKLYQYRNLDN